jgi:hypothetical protein
VVDGSGQPTISGIGRAGQYCLSVASTRLDARAREVGGCVDTGGARSSWGRRSILEERNEPVKYMLLIIGFREGEGMPQPPTTHGGPTAEEFMAYDAAVKKAEIRVDSAVLDTFEDATSVQVNDAGERLITNGPFPETSEYLGGYEIIDVPELDAALDWAARCPGAKYGRVEVRPLAEF